MSNFIGRITGSSNEIPPHPPVVSIAPAAPALEEPAIEPGEQLLDWEKIELELNRMLHDYYRRQREASYLATEKVPQKK